MFLACFDMQLESLVERIELQDSDRNTAFFRSPIHLGRGRDGRRLGDQGLDSIKSVYGRISAPPVSQEG